MDNQRFIKTGGQKFTVTAESYRAYKRPAWAERKRKEREKRCVISNGRGGTKRCTDDCSKCDKQRTGSVLSLDKFIDDGYELADTADLAELVADKLRNRHLTPSGRKTPEEGRRKATRDYGRGKRRQINPHIRLPTLLLLSCGW